MKTPIIKLFFFKKEQCLVQKIEKMEQAMIPLFKMKMVQTCFLLCPLTKEYKLIICQYHTGP